MDRLPPAETDASPGTLASAVKARGRLLGAWVGLLWVVNLVNTLGGHWLDGLGVVPRTLGGLAGIVFAPFLHGSWGHLIANTTMLLTLGFLVKLRSSRGFLAVAALAALASGLGTWLIGPALSVHVGVSGVLFGLLGYLLSRGFFEKKPLSILGSVVGLLVFGSALSGILPGVPGISWQMHLFGFLGGILGSRLAVASPRARARIPSAPAPRARIAPPPTRVAEPEVEEEEVEDELSALKRKMGR